MRTKRRLISAILILGLSIITFVDLIDDPELKDEITTLIKKIKSNLRKKEVSV